MIENTIDYVSDYFAFTADDVIQFRVPRTRKLRILRETFINLEKGQNKKLFSWKGKKKKKRREGYFTEISSL